VAGNLEQEEKEWVVIWGIKTVCSVESVELRVVSQNIDSMTENG
jgi:hypothetical protein